MNVFPHSERLRVGDLEVSATTVLELLDDQLTDRRKARIERVVARRVFSVVPVLDGIYDRGNISAVMRTTEGLGCGAIHVIERFETFKAANRITQGAEKWLDVHTWDDPATCVEHLRAAGFQIVATTLDDAVPLDDVDFGPPTAVVLGNERDGVSETVLAAADVRTVLPMRGFAQSFNISIAAAVFLREALATRTGAELSEDEQHVLRAVYALRSVENAQSILRRKLGA